MSTLKQISEMNPSNYKVIDTRVSKGELKEWGDHIEILIFKPSHQHKEATRKGAYKYGLCEGIN